MNHRHRGELALPLSTVFLRVSQSCTNLWSISHNALSIEYCTVAGERARERARETHKHRNRERETHRETERERPQFLLMASVSNFRIPTGTTGRKHEGGKPGYEIEHILFKITK